MSSFQIKRKISEVNARLEKATDSQEVAQLKNDLQQWKNILHDVQMQEFEDRVGFKSMEQNAGVWGER